LPPLPKITSLNIGDNQLTSLELAPGMTNLEQLFLQDNQLTNLSLPPNLNSLVTLQLANNQITSLTLPADLTSLTTLILNGNPLTTLTLSQQLATTNLAALVASLRNQGVTVIILQTGPNNPPVLAAIPNQTIAVGTSLVITNRATDPDSPPQVLTFSLGAGAPTNATINPATGVFNWRTATAAQLGTNIFTVIVTDNGQPQLSASQSFSVVVLASNSPPPTVIVISGATNLPDGTFQLAFTNTPGASFSVLTSTNLALPVTEWTNAGAVLETSPGSYQFTDETPSTPQRFYRVRSP
jgi:hypothetical protein